MSHKTIKETFFTVFGPQIAVNFAQTFLYAF
jgi:hypothetical protein